MFSSRSEVILRACEFAQSFVPLCLERIGDEPVFWIHLHESPPCQIGFILSTLDMLEADLIDLRYSGLHLAVDLESHIDRERRERFEEQVADCSIDRSSWHRLADRLTVLDPAALADVDRGCWTPASPIPYRHACA